MTPVARPWGGLHVREDGAGPPLLLLHSLGTDHRLWDGVVARLGGFRAIRPDLPGHGLSDRDPAASVESMADDAAALLDGPARVAGVSLGGLVAQALAIRHPGKVAALALIGTAPRLGTPASWAQRVETLARDGLPAMADALMARWFAAPFRDSPAAAPWRTMLARTDPLGYAQACHALAAADLSDAVAGIRAPTLVLTGTEDATAPPEVAAALAARIPGATFATLPGLGHLPMIEDPDVVAGHLRAHFRPSGPEIRRAVLGDAHVDRPGLDPAFLDLITESAWARVWGRATLPLRDRSLLTVALLAALGNDHELALHLGATARTGASGDDLREALLHVAVYAGVPRANRALALLREAVPERP